MSYTTDDFSESLSRVSIPPESIEFVVAAWGSGSGMGTDAGHWKWAEDGATDWSGGFLFKLRDGRYAYVTGWCDYTGWGCQDGAEVTHYDGRPSIPDLLAKDHRTEPVEAEWDIEPADLNKWLADGAKDADRF